MALFVKHLYSGEFTYSGFTGFPLHSVFAAFEDMLKTCVLVRHK